MAGEAVLGIIGLPSDTRCLTAALRGGRRLREGLAVAGRDGSRDGGGLSLQRPACGARNLQVSKEERMRRLLDSEQFLSRLRGLSLTGSFADMHSVHQEANA